MKSNGLSYDEVIESRNKYGNNKIVYEKQNSFFKLLLESLGDPIIKILLIALGIKVIFLIKDFDWYETIGIVIAIFLASFISSISEYGSEKAFINMQEEASKLKCKVIRDGKINSILIDDVVVGDTVILSSGDMVPADGKLVSGYVSVDESVINGESKEMYKNVYSNNTLYRGSVICSDEGTMRVTAVGTNTNYGKMYKNLSNKGPESPLKLRLRKLANFISRIGYVGAVLVALSYLFKMIVINNNFDINLIMATITDFPLISGYILYALTLSVTIIVVAVPEGLPMMITLVLASNMKRMLKNNVLVRKLIGIETAGNINILFTDKTGTLTYGKLKVKKFITSDFQEYDDISKVEEKKLRDIIIKSLIYNNSSIYDKNGSIGGNITDRSLCDFVKVDNSNVIKSDIKTFNSRDKYSSCIVGDYKYIKGAYEKILSYCSFYFNKYGIKSSLLDKKKIETKIKFYESLGYRILMCACGSKEQTNFNNLILVGFVIIKDNVREDAIRGVELVKKAGINTIMITGDNLDTAIAIAKDANIITSNHDLALSSNDLKTMTDDEIGNVLNHLKVIARALPDDKARLVKISQDRGLVVGMTGDGVNDALALKMADVGFSMGSGTEVAKEASDIIIMDDNFLSISKAVLFGRTIFKSIRKFIVFQLTVNLCAISLSIVGPFIGVDTPVTVIQMLWINMIMDTLAGIAFSYEPPNLEYMDESPKGKDESIINKYMVSEILFTGLYSSILCILFLKLPIFTSIFRYDSNSRYLMTAFFGLFIFMGIFNAFNARTSRINLLSKLYENKIFILIILFIIVVQTLLIYYGGSLFRTVGLTVKEFICMLVVSASVIPVDMFRKYLIKRKGMVKVGF